MPALPDPELDGKDRRQHQYRGLGVGELAGDQLGQRVSDEAEADAGRDRIGQRHRHRGDHRRRRFGDVIPVDLGKPARHNAGDVKQSRGRRIGRDHAGERREEQRREEEDRDEERRQPGAAAGGDAGRALDIARRRRGADQGAGIVEHVDEQKTEDDDEERGFGKPREIELQQGRRQRRRRRHDAAEFRQAKRNADRGDDEDADQGAADDAAIVQRRDQHQAEQAQNRLGLVQIAERHQRRLAADYDLGFLERDDAEEQADAGRYGELQVLRDRIDDVLANREDRNQKKDDARAEHGGERLLPGIFHGQHDGKREEGVEPHARRQRDRIIGIERHHQGRYRGRDAGGDEHRALVHAGIAEDLRIDEDDVDHRQEGGQPGDEFGAQVAARFAQAEQTVENR